MVAEPFTELQRAAGHLLHLAGAAGADAVADHRRARDSASGSTAQQLPAEHLACGMTATLLNSRQLAILAPQLLSVPPLHHLTISSKLSLPEAQQRAGWPATGIGQLTPQLTCGSLEVLNQTQCTA